MPSQIGVLISPGIRPGIYTVLHVAAESAVGEAIAAAVSRIGRAAGPPWAADQRHAAAAALVALGSHLGELGAVRLT